MTQRLKQAGKITKIDGYIIHIEGHPTSIEVDIGYLRKHRPNVGGYYILYPDDGYQSFCTAETFERTHYEVWFGDNNDSVHPQPVEDHNILMKEQPNED